MEEVPEQRFVFPHVFNTQMRMMENDVIVRCKTMCCLGQMCDGQVGSIYSVRRLESRSVDALQKGLALGELSLREQPQHVPTVRPLNMFSWCGGVVLLGSVRRQTTSQAAAPSAACPSTASPTPC